MNVFIPTKKIARKFGPYSLIQHIFCVEVVSELVKLDGI